MIRLDLGDFGPPPTDGNGTFLAGNEDLADTDYRDSGYDILCFNDMGLAMVSLYVNLITAFVPEFYEAFCAVSSTPWLAVLFWVSFYVIGVMIVFNVFASFIIDLFLAVYDQGAIEEIETAAAACASRFRRDCASTEVDAVAMPAVAAPSRPVVSLAADDDGGLRQT